MTTENMGGGGPAVLQEPSLRGKVALVTGGNAGIGYATVRKLAARGAKVYLAARSEVRSQTAIERLHEERLGLVADQVVWLPLNLGDPKSVVRAVEDMKTRESRLDILINNAGIGTNGLEVNDAGWERSMAVCHVGHFALTLGLMPLLNSAAEGKGADVRVVTLSSMIIEMIPPDLDAGFTSPTYLSDHRTFSSWSTWLMGVLAFRVDMPRYALAKLANVLFTRELQRRLDAHGIPIIAITMHPGAAATDSIPYVFRWLVRPLVWLTALSPDAVAEVPVFAATDPVVRTEEARYKGSYLLPPGTVAPAHAAAGDERQLRGLWDNTLLQLNDYLIRSGLSPLESL